MGRKIGALIALSALVAVSTQAITLTLADIRDSLTTTKIVDTVFVAPDSTDKEFAVYTRELYACNERNEENAKDAVELVRFENKLVELLQAVYGEEFDPFGPYEELTAVEVEAITLFEIPAYATERLQDEIDGNYWLVDLNLRHTIENLLEILR